MNQYTGEVEKGGRASVGANRMWLAFVLGSLSAFGPLSLDMYLPSLPTLAKELQTTASLAQLSLTFCLLGLSFGQLLAGPLSDMRGRRGPLLTALILYAVSSLLCAFAPSVGVLIALRFVQGVAGSAGIVISRAMVRDLYSGTELTKFFSLLMLVNGAAPILAPVVGGQLLRVISWPGIFVVLSVIGIIMFVAVRFGLPETLPPARRSKAGILPTFSVFGKLLRNRTFIGYALSQGLVVAAMFAYISGSPFVIQDIFGASPQMFSLFFAVNGVGIIIASQVTGRLAGRVREAVLFVSGLLIAACGGVVLLVMILLNAGLAVILIPLFFVVSSVGIVSTAGFSLAMQDQKEAAGSASALLGLLSFVFGALLAPLVGMGGSHTAVPMGVIIACADVGALLCYLFLVRKK
ncbi:multidrug effflux MFS transporter [Aneurinibacillus sp. BA2021]|nr:multidrug effflux MFS transporter [Aneurinibacillus sp. BA2021]